MLSTVLIVYILSCTKGDLVRSEVTVPDVQYVGKLAEISSKNASLRPVVGNVTVLKSNSMSSSKAPFNVSFEVTQIPNLIRPLPISERKEFTVPNAISIIPDGQAYMIYKPDEGSTTKTNDQIEDVEETFTYQVKRRNRSKFLYDGKVLTKSDLQTLFDLNNKGSIADIADIATSTSSNNTNYKNHIKNEADKKVDELERKIENTTFELTRLLDLISGIERKNNETNAGTNSTLSLIMNQLTLLNESYQASSNVSKEMRNNISIDKNRVEGQIQTLSMHLRNTRDLTSDHVRNTSIKLNDVVSKLHNASTEIRMNEIRTRFNQKSISTLDRLVQANNERMTEMGLPIGARWAEQTSGCGGVLVAETGIISYKFRQPYLNNERCIWTIRVNRRSRILLQLLEDGFQNSSNSDFITITEFTEEQPPSLVTSSRIEHGNRASHTFRGPLIFVSFYSDGNGNGNGFTLKFQGAGNFSAPDTLNAIRFHHFHLNEPIGHLTYPEGKNVLYQPNEITTFVINPMNSTALKIHIRYTDLEKEESCEFDSVNFYGSVMTSFALTKKYCDQHHEFSGESVQSSDGTFIVLFRSDASTQFKGFQFSWETL